MHFAYVLMHDRNVEGVFSTLERAKSAGREGARTGEAWSVVRHTLDGLSPRTVAYVRFASDDEEEGVGSSSTAAAFVPAQTSAPTVTTTALRTLRGRSIYAH
jgi:phosphodiesterase/alkaline phosphatase D-like protein